MRGESVNHGGYLRLHYSVSYSGSKSLSDRLIGFQSALFKIFYN
jgi:hypothetical protein